MITGRRCAPCLQRALPACALTLVLVTGGAPPSAQAAPQEPQSAPARSVDAWLTRMHTASRQHSFAGTFVVSSPAGDLSSGRIWHAGEGERQAEKIESLTGAARSTLRLDDQVLTLLPEQRLARLERRLSAGAFPDLLKSRESAVADHYTVREAGTDRVAGFEADVVLIEPRDRYRHGYRIWSERRSGLVIKLQTVDAQGQVLEQAVFSQLQIDPPLRASQVVKTLTPPGGWRVERVQSVRTTAEAEGWELHTPVPGFKALGCYRRDAGGGDTLQCVFSDGLASVSLFVEPYDRQRHGAVPAVLSTGASQTQGRRVQAWWLTAVGEVPPQTLRAFVQALERRK